MCLTFNSPATQTRENCNLLDSGDKERVQCHIDNNNDSRELLINAYKIKKENVNGLSPLTKYETYTDRPET